METSMLNPAKSLIPFGAKLGCATSSSTESMGERNEVD
jgi:hypothetical protein